MQSFKFAEKEVKNIMANMFLSINKGVNIMKKTLVFLVLLILIMGLSASAQIRFKDVPDNSWAAPAVYDLVKRGITDGFPDGTFRGKETLTRYQTAVFLYKMANSIEKKIVSKSEIQRMIRASAGSGGGAAGGAVSGTLFINYTKGLSNTTVANNFDITRAYITIKKQLGAKADAKVVLDSGRTTGRLDTFVKYAYVDLLKVAETDMGYVNARIGMQPTFWSPWVDSILGLRVVASSMVGLDAGITTSDFGVGGVGEVNLGLPVNYVIYAVNGSSFAAAETNAAKTIAGRVDAEIAPNVIAGLGGQIADVDSSGTGSKVITGLIGYKTDLIKAYGELLYGMGSMGTSVAGSYYVLPDCSIYGRVDLWDPNRSTSNDQTTRIWAGAAHDWNANVKILADIGAVTVGTGDAATTATLRTQVNL